MCVCTCVGSVRARALSVLPLKSNFNYDESGISLEDDQHAQLIRMD